MRSDRNVTTLYIYFIHILYTYIFIHIYTRVCICIHLFHTYLFTSYISFFLYCVYLYEICVAIAPLGEPLVFCYASTGTLCSRAIFACVRIDFRALFVCIFSCFARFSLLLCIFNNIYKYVLIYSSYPLFSLYKYVILIL